MGRRAVDRSAAPAQTSARGVWTRSKRPLATAAVLIGITAVVLAPASGTGATYTDAESVTSGAMTIGSVSVDLNAADVSAALAASALAPSQSLVTPLKVTNTGTLAARYSLTSVLTSPNAEDAAVLAPALKLEVKSGTTSCTAAGFETDGTYLYGSAPTGRIADGAPLGSADAAAPLKVLGDPAPGAQVGDRELGAVGTPNSVDTLCARVHLPLEAGNETQNRSAYAALRFSVEQIAGT